MAEAIFRIQSHKFTQDNIEATLVCSKCDEIFSKEFLLDLEGQNIEFKCPVCQALGEADIPYKTAEEREEFDQDLDTDIEMVDEVVLALLQQIRPAESDEFMGNVFDWGESV